MLGPFATTSRLTPIHQMSLAVLSCAACASMSTTTTTTRDRGDRYGSMEWAQRFANPTSVFYLIQKRIIGDKWHHASWSPSQQCRSTEGIWKHSAQWAQLEFHYPSLDLWQYGHWSLQTWKVSLHNFQQVIHKFTTFWKYAQNWWELCKIIVVSY